MVEMKEALGAIVAGHVAIARLLVRAGADLRLTGSGAPAVAAKTAHDLAVARGRDELGARGRTTAVARASRDIVSQ
ncbi:MAG TPA: hypothetical protein VIQ78_00905 [Terrimesophilobacter sp.]|uniref:hypothetical protein n=1 Tax=Terrimesophilobacter sp. TaxID=2906435 RepID=UPI002F95815B